MSSNRLVPALVLAASVLALAGSEAVAAPPSAPLGPVVLIAGTGGSGATGDGGPAVNGQLTTYGVVADALGDVYVSDAANHRVREITPDGVIHTVAGNGTAGSSGDGGQATAARLEQPRGLALDGAGNLYIADLDANRVRRVTPSGTIGTVAGTGAEASTGDGGPATAAAISQPLDVAVDQQSGDLYIATRSTVRKVSRSGTISTFVPTFTVTNGNVMCSFDAWGVAVAPDGTLWIADPNCAGLAKVSRSGAVTPRAGGVSALNEAPEAVAVDAVGNVYITDAVSGTIDRLAGTALTAVTTASPGSTVDAAGGSIYIADYRANQVFMIPPVHTITTSAGSGAVGSGGDGGAATAAQLNFPTRVAADASGAVYIADSGGNRIRKVAPGGTITTVAGTGAAAFSGDGGPAVAAQLSSPAGVAVDRAGDLFVADTGNNRVREVLPDGTIKTVAGTGTPGLSGDLGAATSARLDLPSGLAVDSVGNIYVADMLNNRIREISSGQIRTIAGSGPAGPGTGGFGGDGGAATAALLNLPQDVAVYARGVVYVADSGNDRVRQISSTGVITTFAGTGVRGFAGDFGPARAARLNAPAAVATVPGGSVVIGDTGNNRIRFVSPGGVITTLAGAGASGFSGDGGPASVALLSQPKGMALDASGDVFAADFGNQRVREIVNLRPLARFSTSQRGLRSAWPTTVQLDASASFDPDGRIPSFSWTFSDGSIAAGLRASHTFLIPGAASVTLSVTDEFGATASSSQSLNVPCSIRGTDGPDVITGTPSDDAACGLGGNDLIDGGGGSDVILGGSGDDTLAGGNGNDILIGGPGHDVISCGPGRDTVITDRRDQIARDCEIVRAG